MMKSSFIEINEHYGIRIYFAQPITVQKFENSQQKKKKKRKKSRKREKRTPPLHD